MQSTELIAHDVYDALKEAGRIDGSVHAAAAIRGVIVRALQAAPDESLTSAPPSPGTFGWAIDQLKVGEKLRRHGWNGKGMYLAFSAEKHFDQIAATAETTRQHGEMSRSATRTIGARIDIMAADGVIEVGWRPTSRDMLATDWEVC